MNAEQLLEFLEQHINAEQLLEFLEQHIDELPHLMGAEEWRAFQAELHASVQQMHEGISRDELESAVQPLFEHLNRCPQVREKLRAFSESLRTRRSQSPAQTLTDEQQLNQVVNRFRDLENTRGAASTDEKSEAPKRADKSERHPR
jgi:TolA-binding protein